MRKVPRVTLYWLEHAQNPQRHLKKRAFQHQTCLSPTVYNIFTLIYGLQGWYPHLHLKPKGHFPHETEGPRPFHFKHSHWWKRQSWSKFATSPLRSRDQWSMWMQDGCKVYMDSYMSLNGSCFMVTWTIFKKPYLEVRFETKLGDHDTPNAHNRWFILFYHVWGPAWIKMHWINIWSRTRSHMASHLRVRDHTRWLWRYVGMAFGHFSFGLSQFHGHGSWLVCEVALSWDM